MESAVANLTARPATASPSSATARSASAGSRSASSYGLDVHAIRYEWGESPDPDEVGAAVARVRRGDRLLPAVRHVDRRRRRRARRSSEAVGDATLVVDAISSLGAVPLETDAWGIDVVVSGSQKALMCPPGLAMASVPERVLARAKPSRSFYFDWRANKKAQDELDAAFTPAVSLDPQPRRRARADPRRRSRGRVRAPRAPRPRRARRHQGDGARAVLARRRHALPS